MNTLLLDEVSRAGKRLLAKISKNITRAKHGNADVFFGVIDIVFFGDFVQFPPVLDSPLYSDYKSNTIALTRSNSDIQKKLGAHIWKQLTYIVILDEQMRVTDSAYQVLFNRLRNGKCTPNYYLLLSSRVIGNNSDSITNSGDPITVPGNELVREINNLCINNKSKTRTVYVSTAYDSLKTPLFKDMVKAINSLPSTKTDGMLAELPMYVGMPVMLTKNISTELGLTNGTKGIIKMIPLKENEKCNQSDKGFKKVSSLDYIIIEVPDASISDPDGLPKNHIRIFRCKGSFVLKQNNDNVTIKRDHFPIVPTFSCTAHKSQG